MVACWAAPGRSAAPSGRSTSSVGQTADTKFDSCVQRVRTNDEQGPVGLWLVVPLGVLAGALFVLVVLYWFPFEHLTRTQRVLPGFGAGQHVETFTLKGRLDGTGDAVSITHGGKVPFAPQPGGVQLLLEPAIASGLALITRVRDASGQVVGIATELESGHEDSNLLAGKLMTHTTWTVVAPGRGALVLYQVEDNWTLATRIVGPALVFNQPWHGTGAT